MAIEQPLDPEATAAADDRFYARYPEMHDENGNRIPLSAQNDPNNDMHEDWCRFYEEELAREEGDGDDDEEDDSETPEEEEGDGTSEIPGGEHPTDDVCEDCPHDDDDDEDEDDIPPLSIRGCVFFDGTGNNKWNVNHQDYKDEASYKSGHSNVSKLSTLYLKDQTQRDDEEHITHVGLDAIYVQGIGTTSGGSDSTIGSGLGTGSTGVVNRVNQGIDTLVSNILSVSAGREISVIKVDTFGFSRGAAASRYFVWRTLQDAGNTLRDRLSARVVGEISIKFVGLYDTVASMGVNHANDTNELHLDSIVDAERVVHLAAAEEHRMNFRLTNIASASNGSEYFLPGVHSDVGGGYADDDGDDERDLQLLDLDNPFGITNPFFVPMQLAIRTALNSNWSWMTERGWYSDDELEISLTNELKGTRIGMSNRYSRIPLKIMADEATPWGLRFSGDLAHGTEYRIPSTPVLQTAYAQIKAGLTGSQSASPHFYFNNRASWHRSLRSRHLHFSSYYGVIPTNWDGDYNKLYPPMANWPQFIGGMSSPYLTPILDRLLGGDPYFGHRGRRIQAG